MIPLIKGQRKSNYDYRDNLPVNLTAVKSNIEGDTGYLIAHDGLAEFATVSGVARGGYFNERLNQHFRVSGDQLETISASGEVTVIGDIYGQGTCSFSESFNTQAILSGGMLWLYDGFTLTNVTDEDLGNPIDITWFRGIYVMTDGDYIFHTDIADEYSISPLKYSSSEFGTDPIKGLIRTDSNEIIAFNRYSTEYFYFNANAATGTSVLSSIQGKSSRIGIVGTHCKCFLDGAIFVLGGRKEESPSIHIMNGSQEVPVATREIDKIISQYTEEELQGVFMESRTVDRDKFVIVHLPNETLLYNYTLGQPDVAWSVIKSGECSPWRAKFGIFDPRNSKWVYGDTQEFKLAYLDQQNMAQYGEAQEVLFYTPILPIKRQSINSLELDTISGYTADIKSCFMSISYDGVGWGQEYAINVSKPNDYDTRYIIRRLGYVKNSLSFRFRFVGTEKMAFSGLELNNA